MLIYSYVERKSTPPCEGLCPGSEIDLAVVLHALAVGADPAAITVLGSCPSRNSTIILRVMKLTVALATPGSCRRPPPSCWHSLRSPLRSYRSFSRSAPPICPAPGRTRVGWIRLPSAQLKQLSNCLTVAIGYTPCPLPSRGLPRFSHLGKRSSRSGQSCSKKSPETRPFSACAPFGKKTFRLGDTNAGKSFILREDTDTP